MGCPPLEGEYDQRWVVYSNVAGNDSVPTGSTSDCRWFDAVVIDHKEESDVFLYG
jgi:hypothetical protein